MQVTLNIPDGVVKSLEGFTGPDIARAAIERLALDGYRAHKLSFYDVQRLLGFDNRWDTQRWLGQFNAYPNWTQEDLDAEFRAVDQLLAERRAKA